MGTPFDFEKAPRRSRIEAWILDKSSGQVHAQHGDRKTAAIGAMTGTIVEIGPGSGANMRYFADGVKVIGIEPNPHMHPKLQAKAEEHGVDYEIRTLRGEGIDVDDETADGVVSTLVLCGVHDPGQVVSEAMRVLRPGGTFFFLEHVVAPDATMTRRVQRLVKRPHRWMFNGCEVDRDTTTLLEQAGFSGIDLTAIDSGVRGLHVRHQIVGTATR